MKKKKEEELLDFGIYGRWSESTLKAQTNSRCYCDDVFIPSFPEGIREKHDQDRKEHKKLLKRKLWMMSLESVSELLFLKKELEDNEYDYCYFERHCLHCSLITHVNPLMTGHAHANYKVPVRAQALWYAVMDSHLNIVRGVRFRSANPALSISTRKEFFTYFYVCYHPITIPCSSKYAFIFNNPSILCLVRPLSLVSVKSI